MADLSESQRIGKDPGDSGPSHSRFYHLREGMTAGFNFLFDHSRKTLVA